MAAQLSQWSLCGLFIIAIFVLLKLMAGLLVPIVAAVILGSVLARIGDRLTRYGAPRVLVGIGLVSATGLIIFVLVNALLGPLSSLIATAPQMLGTLVDALAPILQPITQLKEWVLHMSADAKAATPVVMSNNTDWMSSLVGGLSPAIGEFFVFFATLAFFVVGRLSVRRNLILASGRRELRLATIRTINAIELALERYFGAIVMIYAAIAALTSLIAALTGLSNPALWAALVFVASFVPYFGAALITLSLAAGGIVTHHQLGLGLLPAALFLALHLVSENAIIPTILGRRLEINPFAVFMAIVFWTWMWGPIGAIMAVPMLLIGATIIGQIWPAQPELPQ